MTDPRRTPANDRVVAASLNLPSDARPRVAGTVQTIAQPVVDLLRRPDGPRDRQLLLGAEITCFDRHAGWAFVQARTDGYVGYVPETALAPAQNASHWVTAPSSHAYSEADFKSPDRMTVSFGSRVQARCTRGRFVQTDHGWLPLMHLAPLAHRLPDPVAVAESFLGTPYLWGGNSRFGIDCSGLVQMALRACGIACPGDSDQQAAETGVLLPPDSPVHRGDLLFWKGHVALATGPDRIVHANAFHMAVTHELLPQALARIAAQGDGPLTTHRRPG